MIQCRLLLLLFIASLIGINAVRADPALLARQEVQRFIDNLVEQDGFQRAELEKIFRQVRTIPEVVHHMHHPAEAMTWDSYEALFVTQKRISAGVKFLQQQQSILAAIQQKHGVPSVIIVAILGVESNYGTHIMQYRAIDALTNLAFNYPARAAFFQAELKAFLELTRKYRLNTFTILSSYAGAIGPAQFMPDSILHDAVIAPGDANLNSARDWIASISNYLLRRGWRPEAPIADAISCPQSLPETFQINSRQYFYSPQQLAAAGIAPHAKEAAMFIQLSTKSGTRCWLGYRNFAVILRYNSSLLYAMAVYELSNALITESLGERK